MTTTPTTKRATANAIALGVLLGLMAGWLLHLQSQNATLVATVNMYRHQFRQRAGEDEVAGRYHHITLDGGLTWWRCTLSTLPDDSVAVLVDGRADPELVRRLDKLEGGG